MKLRFAWLGDAEYEDSFSAREARILLRAIARNSDIVPLWFAVGSSEPPHFWNGIRIFPVPKECLTSPNFLETLITQQHPQIILSNLPASFFSGLGECLNRKDITWIHRVSPDDLQSGRCPAASIILIGEEARCANFKHSRFVPYIKGLDSAIRDGTDSTTVLQKLKETIGNEKTSRLSTGSPNHTHLVMRQQLFYNSSLSQVMFELTNALLEAGVPTVPQDEHAIFSGNNFHRDEAFFRSGAPEKYEKICQSLQKEYDPENAITVHFVLLKSAQEYTRHGTFPSLAGREVLYVTGNHTVSPADLQELAKSFEMIVAPSEHVLKPYLEAGLDRRFGAVVPHGVDPLLYSPEIAPFQYPTKKRFKFLQTSFPWVYDKGFDLTIKAFGKAFSNRDDVALILRVPRIRDLDARESYFGQLESLVKEELAKPGAPEILLLELDVELNRRGSIYTGANCYVHPLRAEGFGMTILEAMACGLPVIATSWSGPADFLSPRWAYTLRHSDLVPEKAENGTILRYHVEPDLDHLIYLMRYAYEHEDEGKALGQQAASVVRDKWTWKHATAKLTSLLLQAAPNVFGDGNKMVNVQERLLRPPSGKHKDASSNFSKDSRKAVNVRARLNEQLIGEHKDQNDDRIARRGRSHEGHRNFKHKFIQPAPLLFTQDHHPLWLGDIYRGRSAFLIAGGPSFASVNHSKLRQPGILTMGINNSVKTFRPNLWVCVDRPDHFLRSIWLDPTIMKFVPIGHASKFIFNSDEWKFMDLRVGDCSNVVYFKRNEHFNAKQFLWEDTINWGNHEDFGGGRSVMLAALRILFILGIRRVYLLGVDFKMDDKNKYHFEQDRHKSSIKGNNTTYRQLNKRFAKLRPYFENEKFSVFNCNPSSNLKVFDVISFEMAIQNILEEFDSVDVHNERAKGLYDTNIKDKEQGNGK